MDRLTGASLILEKHFSSSSFYDIACFSVLVSGPRLDAPITSENILRRSSIDNVVDHLHDASHVLEDFSSRSRIPIIIKCLNSRSLWPPFGWSTMRNFSEGPVLSIGPF